MSARERCSGLVAVLRRRMRADERGVVAILVVLSLSGFMFATAAIGVDVAHWYLEAQRVQKAADVSALGSVTYLPQDMASANAMALTISSRNGYPNSGTSTVTTAPGPRLSQIRVTVCSQVTNTFGGIIGTPKTTVCRTAVADYTGPAPMGSPCNTFGNEPSSGGGPKAQTPAGSARSKSPFPNCVMRPQFWATVAGPETDKSNGDRYQAATCKNGTSIDGCDSSKTNTEYDPEGYFWLVRVQPGAEKKQINLQIYDPAFVNASTNCGTLPTASSWSTNSPNDYVTDAKLRYSRDSVDPPATPPGSSPYCTGDSVPALSTSTLPTTSFAVRQQTDTLDPRRAPLQASDSGTSCIKQFTGQTSAPKTTDLTSSSKTYDDQLSQVFHNWYSLCKFTPARAGDYYVQVRTNVSADPKTVLGNTNSNPAIIYSGNTHVLDPTGNLSKGGGNNSFAIRAVTQPGSENLVSVSGYDRMPIFANADSAISTFNLIRVTPGGAGKSISFSYFDVGDATGKGGGTVQVIPPADADGSIKGTPFPGGCRAAGGKAGTGPTTISNCSAPFDSSNNGYTETISIPIPNDYKCTYDSPGGCWYQVQVQFNGGSNVTDVTTWTASITGEPVRLIE